jgi:aspartate ammonia-lyase
MMMSLTQLTSGCYTLADRCVDGITANVDRLRESVANSIGLVTALAPMLGYETATEVAQRAATEDKTVREVVLELDLMSAQEFEAILGDVERLTRPVR